MSRELRTLAERLDFMAETSDMGREPDPSSVTRRSAKAMREAADTIRRYREALEATPLRARNETGEDFDARQKAWLREHYDPCLARQALQEPTP